MASKAVLITGCSTGIGRKTAEHLAAEGLDGLRDGAQARVDRGPRAEGLQDARARRDRRGARCRRPSRAVEEAEGAVGVLINNAGYSQSGAVEEVPMDQVRRQFETNVFGLLRMCQLVLPGMRKQGFGQDREHLVDGRPARVPGRRHLPRHEVRGRGDQRRDALGGARLRRRRDPDRARPDQDRVRRDRGALGERGDAVRRPVRASSTSWSRRRRPAPTRGAGATGPEAVAKRIEKAISRKRPGTRYPITVGRARAARRAEGAAGARLGRADADSVQAAGRLGAATRQPRRPGRPAGTPRCTRARRGARGRRPVGPRCRASGPRTRAAAARSCAIWKSAAFGCSPPITPSAEERVDPVDPARAPPPGPRVTFSSVEWL